MSLNDDIFMVSKDSLRLPAAQSANIPELAALENDTLCPPVYQQHVRVSQTPQFGTATVSANGFKYQVASGVNIESTFSDSFIYEVCIDSTCKTAKVQVKVK
jgi:hypothetical protein